MRQSPVRRLRGTEGRAISRMSDIARYAQCGATGFSRACGAGDVEAIVVVDFFCAGLGMGFALHFRTRRVHKSRESVSPCASNTMPTVPHVEDQILDFLRQRPRVMFLDLADILNGFSWQVLLSALSRLHGSGHVDLHPHPLGQEIVLRQHHPEELSRLHGRGAGAASNPGRRGGRTSQGT